MKDKFMGLIVTGLIICVFIAISWRVPFLKKLVYGA